jgi:MIP family channel proteins
MSRSNYGVLCCSLHLQIIAEIFGTYFLMFAGCGAVTINASKNGQITFPGVAIVWGLAVMVMVYAVGHISGAHFNPAVTLAFATSGRFPWRQLPAYVLAQMLGATLASGTLRLMFGGRHEHFPGTLPTGSEVQSLVIEIITTFYLMFVISGVATDNRAVSRCCHFVCLFVCFFLFRSFNPYVLCIYICRSGSWLGWPWAQPSCLTCSLPGEYLRYIYLLFVTCSLPGIYIFCTKFK